MHPVHVPATASAPLDIFGVHVQVLVPAAVTGDRFSLFEETTPAGEGPPLHVHQHEEEFFRVLAGRYRFRVGQDDLDLGPGDTLVVPRGTPHTFFNPGRTAGRLAMGFVPGGAEGFFERVAAAGLTVPRDMHEIADLAERHGLTFLEPNPYL